MLCCVAGLLQECEGKVDAVLITNPAWVTLNRAGAVVSWHQNKIWVNDVGWLISLLVVYGWCAYWMM